MKGAYVLLIRLGGDRNIRIGALGTVSFPTGFYAYTGSSMVNLEKRVERHFGEEKREECGINRKVFDTDGGKIAVKGFGSSDCSCEAHLAYFAKTQPHFEYPQERQTMHPPS